MIDRAKPWDTDDADDCRTCNRCGEPLECNQGHWTELCVDCSHEYDAACDKDD